MRFRSVLLVLGITAFSISAQTLYLSNVRPRDAVYVRILSRVITKECFIRADAPLFLPSPSRISEDARGASKDVILRITAKGEIEIARNGRVFYYHNDTQLRFPSFEGRIAKTADELASAREYSGALTIREEQGALALILAVPEELYIASAVQSEKVPGSTREEALKALAIAARSYLHARGGGTLRFPLPDTTSAQLFRGNDFDRRALYAARATEARIIVTDTGEAFPAFYSATVGGHTIIPNELWTTRAFMPYFSVVTNAIEGVPLYAASPHAAWETTITRNEARAIAKRLNAPGHMPTRFETHEGILTAVYYGNQRIDAWTFRRAAGALIGWNRIKSVYATARITGNGIMFSGEGLGHNIGMCVYGSDELAKRGFLAEEILAFYFPCLALEKR